MIFSGVPQKPSDLDSKRFKTSSVNFSNPSKFEASCNNSNFLNDLLGLKKSPVL